IRHPRASEVRSGPPDAQPAWSSWAATCAPMPSVGGNVIQVSQPQADQLSDIVAAAPPHSVIVLADGVYRVRKALLFRQPDVTLRSRAAQERIDFNPEHVVIDGSNSPGGQSTPPAANRVPELIGVLASNVTISDISLKNARDHLIHVAVAG